MVLDGTLVFRYNQKDVLTKLNVVLGDWLYDKAFSKCTAIVPNTGEAGERICHPRSDWPRDRDPLDDVGGDLHHPLLRVQLGAELERAGAKHTLKTTTDSQAPL